MNYEIYIFIITLLLSISIIIIAISIIINVILTRKLISNLIKVDNMQTEIITEIVNNQKKWVENDRQNNY